MVPTYIYKVAKDRDLYMGWSTIVESPTWFGSRAWAIASGEDPARLDRADRLGTSCQWEMPPHPICGAWDDHGEIYEQRGVLPRAKFGELADRLMADPRADVSDLLEPFEDDA